MVNDENYIGLSDAEKLVVINAGLGNQTYLNNQQVVRAEIICSLLLGVAFRGNSKWLFKQLMIKGGQVQGDLDLTGCELDVNLSLTHMHIDGEINLSNGKTADVDLTGSQFNAFLGFGLEVVGELKLDNARIKNRFIITESVIGKPTENWFPKNVLSAVSLECETCQIYGSTINGSIKFDNANINGEFLIDRAYPFDESANQTYPRGTDIRGSLWFKYARVRNAFKLVSVSMHSLILSNSNFDSSILIEDSKIKAQISGERIQVVALDFVNSLITGGVDLSQSTIKFFDSFATNINVRGFPTTLPTLNLKQTQIGRMYVTGAYQDSNDNAIITGEINLSDAKLESIIFESVCMVASNTVAIRAENLYVQADFLFKVGCHCKGAIILTGATIIGEFDLGGVKVISSSEAKIETDQESQDFSFKNLAIDLNEAKVERLTFPQQEALKVIGDVNLTRTKVGTFTDYKETWPSVINDNQITNKSKLNNLILNGFEYEHLTNPSGEAGDIKNIVKNRKEWLLNQPQDDVASHFKPQPWRQLAQVISRAGFEQEARQLVIERRVKSRVTEKMFQKWVSCFLHVVSDYGFSPWKTVGWSGGTVLLFAALYTMIGYNFVSNAMEVCDAHFLPLCFNENSFVRIVAGDMPSEPNILNIYPVFDPILYSFDTFIPILNLGAESYWRINDNFNGSGYWLQWLTVVEQIIGGIFVSLIITGFTGLLTKDEPA